MALSGSDIYRLNAEQLRKCCVERYLCADGPVRVLRRRLADYVRVNMTDQQRLPGASQASVPNDLVPDHFVTTPPISNEVSQGGGVGSQFAVLLDLLRQVKPLLSEEPVDILRLFVRLEEVYELKLVDDSQFIARILPLVFGSLLKFLGECRREECSWAVCKSRLLDEYFPYFVRERLIRDLIIFKFHGVGESMRSYVDQVFQAAIFLQYGATEQELVDRVLMNLHPEVLAQSAFLDRPRSRKEMYKIMGLIEEKMSVAIERQRVEQEVRGELRGRVVSRDVPRAARQRPGTVAARCWGCGQIGHFQRQCPVRNRQSGNERRPGGQAAPGGSS